MRAFETYKKLDRKIIELSSVYQNLPNNTTARTGKSRKASTTFSTTSGSDATPRKRRYVVDMTVISDGESYDEDDEGDEKHESGSGSDTCLE